MSRWGRRAVIVRLALGGAAALGVVQVATIRAHHEQVVTAYGLSRGLDMTTFLGHEIAGREAPYPEDSALFTLLCVLVTAALLRQVEDGAPWAKLLALGLTLAGGLNALGALAGPAPGWYHALLAPGAALALLAAGSLWRVPMVHDRYERMDARERRRAARRG